MIDKNEFLAAMTQWLHLAADSQQSQDVVGAKRAMQSPHTSPGAVITRKKTTLTMVSGRCVMT